MSEADNLAFIASLFRTGDATPGEQIAASMKLREIITRVRRLERTLDEITQDAMDEARDAEHRATPNVVPMRGVL